MNASTNCVALIEKFEGFSPVPYICPAGITTIGIGSTHHMDGSVISMGDPAITHDDAVALMLYQLKNYENTVNDYVTSFLNQNQFDALVDFCYNCGSQNFRTSTLLRLLNNKSYDEASDEFGKWIYGGGHILQGLVDRRQDERDLFLS